MWLADVAESKFDVFSLFCCCKDKHRFYARQQKFFFVDKFFLVVFKYNHGIKVFIRIQKQMVLIKWSIRNFVFVYSKCLIINVMYWCLSAYTIIQKEKNQFLNVECKLLLTIYQNKSTNFCFWLDFAIIEWQYNW